MTTFERTKSAPAGSVPLSIKVRVTSGCFHPEHSPRGYNLLAAYPFPSDVELVEHETGPELLAYAAVATAGLTLVKSVIDLITAILKARADGIRKGDGPTAPLELIVRRIDDGNEFREEMVLRIGHTESVDAKAIEKQVEEALRKLSKK